MGSSGQPSSELSERQRRVLHALCREYVVSGRPVSSLALSRRHRIKWSSATIRSELAELERRGFLLQPHPAAGRYPTASGLAVYLEDMAGSPARPEHRRAIDLTLRAAGHASLMRSAARALAGLVGCVGIGFVGQSHVGVLERVQLVHLAGADALAVLEMHDGSQSVRRVRLATASSGDAVTRIGDRLRVLIEGRTLQAAREHLRGVMSEHEARVDALLGEAVRLGLTVCSTACLDPLSMQVVGQATLAGAPRVSDDLPQVLELLEDYHRLADVLCQLLPDDEEGRAQIHLDVALGSGRSEGHAGLSLVGCRLAVIGVGDEVPQTGAVAVLGPDSMDYEAVIPLVEYAARAIGTRA